MAFSRDQQEFLEDFISQHHAHKHIVVRAMDGENLENLGFLSFMRRLCEIFRISAHRVTVISSKRSDDAWQWIPAPYTIFWSVDGVTDAADHTRLDARLFGITVGRFNPFRHRLLQILRRELDSEIFLVCNYTPQEVQAFYQKNTDQAYDDFRWMLDQRFEVDHALPNDFRYNGTIPWQIACQSYATLSSHWHIEIIVETDFYMPSWFTEKTSKCLYHGKPFVLIGGTGSLQNIRDMGFQTFNGIIDENYDLELTFDARVRQVCQQLTMIKNSPDPQGIVGAMLARAEYNRQNWLSIKQRNFNR